MKNKTKNNERLARNTIRARKAQKKRTNEQDKPKTGKRWITRLFAFVGCLLLVSALVVPCFAAYPPTPDYDFAFEIGYELLIAEIATDYDVMFDQNGINPSYSSFVDDYLGGFEPFYFDSGYELFTSGFVTLAAHSVDEFRYYNTPNGGVVIESNFFDTYVHAGADSPNGYHDIAKSFYNDCTVRVYFDDEGDVSIIFGQRNGEDLVRFLDMAYYKNEIEDILGNVIVQYELHDVRFWNNGSLVSSYSGASLDYLELSLCIGYESYVGMPTYSFMSDLAYLLFGPSVQVAYPQPEAHAFSRAWDRAKQEGLNVADLAFHDGWDASGGSYADGFDAGYQDAVNNIESGDFGRNFLGGVFSAPIDALKSFEIVSWTTEGGTEISITIMTFLSAAVGISLFIWFMKMFAGG